MRRGLLQHHPSAVPDPSTSRYKNHSATNCSLVTWMFSYFESLFLTAGRLLRLWRALSHSQTQGGSISSFIWYRKRGFCVFPDGHISNNNRSGLTSCLCFCLPSFHQHTRGFPQPLWWKPGFDLDDDAGSLPVTSCHQHEDSLDLKVSWCHCGCL